MSELAFNLNGEPFELPAAAVGWRVRRIKGRGAPEVVYSRDGVPLILPIDADIDDLRHAARGEGRFRLDPVDDHNRMIPQMAAGYVCVQPAESASELIPLPSRSPTDNVAIEAMRMNTELARTIIDRFPMMIDAAAGLLRAADGAGLPAREPRAILDVGEVDEDNDDRDDQDDAQAAEVVPKATGLAGLLETLVPLVMPAIVDAVASGGLKIPGGIGALLDCRRASPKGRAQAAAPAPHTTHTPGAVPAPGPRDPAPASSGAAHVRSGVPRESVPRDAARRSSGSAPSRAADRRDAGSSAGAPSWEGIGRRSPGLTASDIAPARAASADGPELGRTQPAASHDATPAAVGASGPRRAVNAAPVDGAVADVGPPETSDGTASAPTVSGEPTTEPASDVPTLDAAALAHFAAIQGALTFRESMLARALAAELTPADLRTWLCELRELSVPDAVTRIRGVLGDEGNDDVGAAS